jgi:hypothetical protein
MGDIECRLQTRERRCHPINTTCMVLPTTVAISVMDIVSRNFYLSLDMRVDTVISDTAFIASRGGWLYCDDSRVQQTDAKEVVVRLTACCTPLS